MAIIRFRTSSLNSFKGYMSRLCSAGLVIFVAATACAQEQEYSLSSEQHVPSRSLEALIATELRETRAELAETGFEVGVLPPEMTSSPRQSAFSAETCRASDPTDFFRLFAGGIQRPIDVAALAASVYASRPTVGFDAEDQLPQDDTSASALPWRAVLDTALGTWKREHYNNVEDEADLNPTEIAIVWRTWCRVGVENDAILGEYLSRYGFPTEAATTPQIAAQAFNIYKHTTNGSPTQERYVEMAALAHEEGQLDGPTFALILDTDAQKHGRPLPYGTYTECRNGEAVVAGDVEDEAHLNERRAEVGLWPLEQQLAQAAPFCSEERR